MIDPGNHVSASDLQTAWRLWCEEHGNEPGSDATFGTKLRAVLPNIQRLRRRTDNRQEYHYGGLSLTSEMTTKLKHHRCGLYPAS